MFQRSNSRAIAVITCATASIAFAIGPATTANGTLSATAWVGNDISYVSTSQFGIQSATGSMYQSVAVMGGQTYTYSFRFRAESALGVKLAVFDETGGDWIEDGYLYSTVPTSNANSVAYTFTTPQLCKSVRLYPIYGVTRPGTIDLDSFQFAASAAQPAPKYYVDSAAGNDSNDGRSPDRPWRSLNKATSAVLHAGDIVALKRGSIWRETMSIKASGTAGLPTTIAAYGTGRKPRISGADLISNWSLVPGSVIVWQASLAINPMTVKFNDTRAGQAKSLTTLSAATPWFWKAATLYVYCESNPSAKYWTPGIEASQRYTGVWVKGGNNYLFRDLQIDMANGFGLYLDAGASSVRAEALEISHAGLYGFLGNSASMKSKIIFEHGVIHHSASFGLAANPNSANWTVRDSEFHHNGAVDGSNELRWGGNVSVGGFGTVCGPHVFERLLLHHAGYDDNNGRVTSQDRKGFGIWFDTVDTAEGSTVRDSVSFGNADSGIFIEKSRFIQAARLVAFDNGQYGLRIDADADSFVGDNQVYQLTAYGNDVGIYVAGGYLQTSLHCARNVIKNSISTGNHTRQLWVRWGGQNDSVNGTGNVYEHNAFGPEIPGFIQWGTSTLTTYNSADSWYRAPMYNMRLDPMLVDAPARDLRLSRYSPAIDGGVRVNGVNDSFVGLAPDIGWFESGTESTLN